MPNKNVLSQLGNEICFAKDEQTAQQKKIDAFMSVELFKRVYDYYGGSKAIPTEKDFFGNVLQKEFKLNPDCLASVESGLSPVHV